MNDKIMDDQNGWLINKYSKVDFYRPFDSFKFKSSLFKCVQKGSFQFSYEPFLSIQVPRFVLNKTISKTSFELENQVFFLIYRSMIIFK